MRTLHAPTVAISMNPAANVKANSEKFLKQLGAL
jgi:hypothetical protein